MKDDKKTDYQKVLADYDAEFELDVSHDMITLSAMTLKHSTIYHKWVVRLRNHEWNFLKVSRKMEDYVEKKSKAEKQVLPNISEVKLKNKIHSSEGYIEARRILENEQHVIEHLKKLIRILDQMGFNFKVSTEHYKLELAP